MRAIVTVICLALAPTAAAHAASPPGPTATVSEFINSFNKGDSKAAEATHTADAVIIDEFAPHRWVGPGAFSAWAAALEKDGKDKGQSAQHVGLGKADRVLVEGDTAYVVVPATYTYKEKGKAMVEPAHMAFSLAKGADGWKINGWTWAGTVPHAAAAPKPKAAVPATPATPATPEKK
jgi:ketosteroid isomerase-like protein